MAALFTLYTQHSQESTEAQETCTGVVGVRGRQKKGMRKEGIIWAFLNHLLLLFQA